MQYENPIVHLKERPHVFELIVLLDYSFTFVSQLFALLTKK